MLRGYVSEYLSCGDGCFDVKGKIETTEEWTKIRLFKVWAYL